MLIGVGVDLTEIPRVERLLELYGDRFVARVLSSEEMMHFMGMRSERRRLEFLAGRWAVKEALTKALTNLLGEEEYAALGLSMRDVTFLRGRLSLRTVVPGIELSASLTHTRELALAFVVAIRRELLEGVM